MEPLKDLFARMSHSGPYKYPAYRIMPVKKTELVIKPTCTGCGIMAGVDCHRACESIFGPCGVLEGLPITFNDDHQFCLAVKVVTKGKHFGKERPKAAWFNSVRCAELFLTEQGLIPVSKATFGDGARLLRYLGGDEIVKSRKKRAPNKAYLAKLSPANPGLLATA